MLLCAVGCGYIHEVINMVEYVYIKGNRYLKSKCRRIYIGKASGGVVTAESANKIAKEYRAMGYPVSIRKL
jgi:hypothetical protein